MKSTRNTIQNIATNDANYPVAPIINGKQILCPFYSKWKSMITRCYSKANHKKHPTYKGCTVCDKWLTFSNFKAWMMTQDWQGMHLDKDIINPGNKIYSPESCVFITQDLNNLFCDHRAKKGDYPIGVHLRKQTGKYQSIISVNSTKTHIGLYCTPQSASRAYIKIKISLIIKASENHTDIRVSRGLLEHARIIKLNYLL